MSDTASPVSVSIFEEASSNTTRRHYRILLTDESGAPVAGEDVVLTLVGDGSFVPNFKSEEIKRESDAEGKSQFTWYRRSIFGRDVKATVSAQADKPGRAVSLEEILDKPPELAINWVPEVFKLRPPRA